MHKLIFYVKNINGDSMKKNQKIGCSVHDCKYCIYDNDMCSLNNIIICNCHGTGNMEKTMCGSYEKK